MQMKIATLLLFLVFPSNRLAAQTIAVGALPANTPVAVNRPVPFTVVAFGEPASASVAVTSATFRYSATPCPGAVKIKFFHPQILEFLLTERGPFDVSSSPQTVPIDPPVTLQRGDTIAMTVLTGCGGPLASDSGGSFGVISGDYPGGPFSPQVEIGVLALAGFGTPTANNGIARVIPVVYTGPGAFSSSFRTEIWLHNSSAQPVSGLLVPLISGPAIRASFPQPYAVAPGATVTVPPPTGFGSVEIVPAVGPAPAAAVLISSEVATTGTVGFSVPVVSPSEALGAGEEGSLIGPGDPENFRLNVGFVALSPATIEMTLRADDGTLLKGLTLTVSTFAQLSAGQLFGVSLPVSAGIDFRVLLGQVLVYGVAADNRTNDGSFQLAARTLSPSP